MFALCLMAIVLGVVLFFMIRNDYKQSNHVNKTIQLDKNDQNSNNSKSNEGKIEKEVEPDGIVCWGDSLTVGLAGGYPKVLEDLIANAGLNIPVENEGVTSENTKQIMARAGVTPYKVADAIIIPEKIEPVFLRVIGEKERLVTYFPKDKFQYTDVTINGVQGKLSRNNNKSGWDFTRNTAGKSAYIPSNTLIRFDYVNRYKNYIPIIFMGTNGGFSSIEDLIEQQQAILDIFPENDKFLIIGLTHQTVANEDKLDQELEAHWGKHFINLREYFSGQGVYDAGFKPKSTDLAQMKEGTVPDIMRTDAVHFRQEGYEVLGKYIYQRLKELDYVKK